MIIHRDIEQGTPAWHYIRLGMITMSCLDKIITPAKMLPSASQAGYMNFLISELWYGRPLDTFVSKAMRDGSEEEEVSVDAYTFLNDCAVEKVGFIENDGGYAGCSPDALRLDV